MKLTRILATVALIVTAASCAKERSTERVYDLDGDRWPKATFVSEKPWMSKITVVKTSQRSGVQFVGQQSELNVGTFEFSRDKLLYKSAVKLYNDNSSVEDTILNSWDIKHSDYRLAESDGRVLNKEMEDDRRPWQDKNYFKIDFKTAKISIKDEWNDCWKVIDQRLQEEETVVSPEHITFTVAVDYQQQCYDPSRSVTQDHVETVHYKYSFAPLPETDYQPYEYKSENDPLMAKYGYFNSVVPTLDPETNRGVNRFLMDRWHPEKVHTYYFAEDFPEEYKWVYNDPKIGVMAKVNEVFASKNLPIRFEIKDADGKEVKYGDVRKSFIKFVKEHDPNAPLGYGPHTVNPFTGEIIAGEVVVWTGSLDFYVELLEGEIGREPDRDLKSTLYQAMYGTMGSAEGDKSSWVSTAQNLKRGSESGEAFIKLLPHYTYGLPYWNQFTGHENPSFEAPVDATFLGRRRSASEYTGLMDLNTKGLTEKVLQTVDQIAKTHQRDNYLVRKKEEAYSTSIDHALIDASNLILDGKTKKQIVDTIVYRVAMHEFGHNLNLRHNFYGSVDAAHFGSATPAVDENGHPVMEEVKVIGEDGQESVTVRQKMYQQKTSSIMDYQSLRDEMVENWDMETYDRAALLYAYSSGKIDMSKAVHNGKEDTQFLYCTDEHRPLNAMCNTWDHGTTPTEVALSLIEDYEDGYWVRNYRFNRAFWNTESYPAAIYGTMHDLKKFLAMYNTTFDEGENKNVLAGQGYSDEQIRVLSRDINKDLLQATKLTVAFYDAVIRQSSTDRPYEDIYSDFNGGLERKGIFWDKIFAMLFLLGDDALAYDPSRPASTTSFLSLYDNAELGNFLTKILENSVTERVEIRSGFEDFGRSLYALNAMNTRNQSNAKLIQKIKMECYKPESLPRYFEGLDPYNFAASADEDGTVLDVALLDLLQYTPTAIAGADYKDGNEKMGIIKIDGNYYVALEVKNAYAYGLIKKLMNETGSIVPDKIRIRQLYQLYLQVTEGVIPECK